MSAVSRPRIVTDSDRTHYVTPLSVCMLVYSNSHPFGIVMPSPSPLPSDPSELDRISARHIAIIGGGISGLTAAYRLKQLRPEWRVTIFDANERLGGVLQTSFHDGFLVEHSADNFIANRAAPWARQFCQEIGFSDEIIPTHEKNRRAVIWFNGEQHPVPDGFQLMKTSSMASVLRSRLLSWQGKVRLAAEPLVATKPAGEGRDPNRVADESLASFAIRRLGREAFERLVQPLVSGIYTADANKLSMNAALPQFVTMEQTAGSIAAAAFAERQRESAERDGRSSAKVSGARYNQFWAPRHGMSSFIDAIQQKLDGVNIRKQTTVHSVCRERNEWQVNLADGSSERFDGIIVCLPAAVGARIVEHADSRLALALDSIEHASSAVVCLGYAKSQFQVPLNSFGCVVPSIAKRRVIAISNSSMKFPNRAPHGHHLLRVFLGGALQPEYASLPDAQTLQIAIEEVATILKVAGSPVFEMVQRWPHTMPQYHLNHLDRVASIRERVSELPSFELESNALDGVGIPQRVRAGDDAARRLVSDMRE